MIRTLRSFLPNIQIPFFPLAKAWEKRISFPRVMAPSGSLKHRQFTQVPSRFFGNWPSNAVTFEVRADEYPKSVFHFPKNSEEIETFIKMVGSDPHPTFEIHCPKSSLQDREAEVKQLLMTLSKRISGIALTTGIFLKEYIKLSGDLSEVAHQICQKSHEFNITVKG